MNPALDKKLCEDFPNLYRDRNVGCMVYGFPGDGWEPLIRRLSEKLEPMGVVASQVKEKFGTMRFYLVGYTDETISLISDAEEESARTCETCGAPGKLSGKVYVTTKCALHRKTNTDA